MIYYVRKTTNGNYRVYNALTDAVLPNIAGCADLRQVRKRLAEQDPEYGLMEDDLFQSSSDTDLLLRIDYTRAMLASRKIEAQARDGFDYTNSAAVLLKQASLRIRQLVSERDALRLQKPSN